MAERRGADLQAAGVAEAILDRDRKVARLLGLDQHVGRQLGQLTNERSEQDLGIPGMCDHGPIQRAHHDLASRGGSHKPVAQRVERCGRADLHGFIFA